MIITKEWLIENKACTDGVTWFTANYPDGADHKDVYLALEKANKHWGYWLLGHIGGAEFAIRCAMTVCKDESWTLWATRWLDGTDRSVATARSAVWSAAESARSAARLAARLTWSAAESAAESAESARLAARLAAESAAESASSYRSLLYILDECGEDKP
jgi:hypothetical protein